MQTPSAIDAHENSTAEPPVASTKGWVWHSTLATRAAGQVSVLAVMETLLAIVLYWWIAIRFETHWHLVSSVFIAPLLLLRSPESMDTGVRWFLKDWFKLSSYQNWRSAELACWRIVVGVAAFVFSYSVSNSMRNHWLWEFSVKPLIYEAIVIGLFSLTTVVALAVAITFCKNAPHFDSMAAVFVGAMPGTFAGVGLGLDSAVIWHVGVCFIACLVPSICIGITLRALIVRVLAIVFHLSSGIHRLPENWKENILLTDFRLPVDVLPSIGDHLPIYSLSGLLLRLSNTKVPLRYILLSLMGIFLFIPAHLYRLNIKATAWFWWPLAYLLKPAPAANAEGAQRQGLCWPWSNPAQRCLIGLSIGLALLSLVLHWLMASTRIELGFVNSLPLAVKVSLGWGWTDLAPCHWALWIIAASGAGMLLLAGNACSHHANDNWSQYSERWPQNICWMTALSRVRRLAVVALLVMSLGALLLQDRTWQVYVPVPESWIRVLEKFYQFRP